MLAVHTRTANQTLRKDVFICGSITAGLIHSPKNGLVRLRLAQNEAPVKVVLPSLFVGLLLLMLWADYIRTLGALDGVSNNKDGLPMGRSMERSTGSHGVP